jgi:hypothetical protein
MGWCSGTDIFDKGLQLFWNYVPQSERAKVLSEWYEYFASLDADCLDESDYYEELDIYGLRDGQE